MKKRISVMTAVLIASLILSSCDVDVSITINSTGTHIVLSPSATAAKAAAGEAKEEDEAAADDEVTDAETADVGESETASGEASESEAAAFGEVQESEAAASVDIPETPAPTESIEHQHEFVETGRTPSDCVTAGSIIYTCSCGETKSEILPPAEHIPVESVERQATCRTTGIVHTVCAVCGEVLSTVETPLTGHLPSDWIMTVPAGTGTEGEAVMVCQTCGETLDTAVIPALPNIDAGAYCQQVLALVNAERVKEGLAPLAWNQAAAGAAALRAQEIVTLFEHDRPNGTQCFTALNEAGVPFMTAGENIAAGHQTPEAVVSEWMNSPGHRENIMNPSFTQLGVGIAFGGGYGIYWVQLFIG